MMAARHPQVEWEGRADTTVCAPPPTQSYDAQMGARSAVRFDLDAPGSLDDFRRSLDQLGKSERTIENAIARDLSTSAAERIRPMVARAVRTSPAPQAAALAETARSKRDRMIVVTVGATNPRLSGWRRSSANKKWRGSLAYGVALGGPGSTSQQVAGHRRKAHRRAGTRIASTQVSGHTRRQGNIYRIARRGNPSDPFSGWLAGHRESVIDAAKQEYADIILELARRNGWQIT